MLILNVHNHDKKEGAFSLYPPVDLCISVVVYNGETMGSNYSFQSQRIPLSGGTRESYSIWGKVQVTNMLISHSDFQVDKHQASKTSITLVIHVVAILDLAFGLL